MNSSGKKRRKRRPAYGDAPLEKHIALSEECISTLITKQIDTCVSLKGELSRSKAFTNGYMLSNLTSSTCGKLSLEQFKDFIEKEEQVSKLREYGLSNKDIHFKLSCDGHNHNDSKASTQMKNINVKIEHHETELNQPIIYSDVLKVNRREMEINQSLYRGTSSNQTSLNHLILIEYQTTSYPANDAVVATLKYYEESEKAAQINKDNLFIGPVLSDVNTRVEICSKEFIFRNKITLEEILQIERFKDYRSGKESRILYIKNLSRNVTDKDLAKLFARFHSSDKPVDYKVMSGRMRGQAFITFVDVQTAKEALLLCNGFVMDGRPLIISFGKSKPIT